MATLQTYNATVQSLSSLMHLRLSEGAGTTAVDDADDLDGQYRGGVTLGADGQIGNGAVSLDGSTGHVVVPAQNQLQLANGTFEMWFTPERLAGRQSLFEINAASGEPGRFAMQLRENGSLAAIISGEAGNPEAVSPAGVAPVGEPVHLAFTFGAGGMHLFVDGVEVASNPFTGNLVGTAEPLVLGASSGFSTPGGTLDNLQRFFLGTIDEFVVYDRALSPAQVQRLFQAGERGPELVGTAEDDTLIGGLDADIMRGLAGDDTLLGGRGNDVLSGDAGDDVLNGGAGNDQLFGRAGADTLLGGPGNDVLQGNAGPDQLTGGPGNDQLFGNLGPDILRGGPGNDLLDGGPGPDTLVGGGGSDTFRITAIGPGVDRVLDFQDGPGGDVLGLNEVLDFGPGDLASSFVRLNESGGNTQVAVNPAGTGQSFTPVFNLVGVTGTTVDQLVADGNLQLAAPAA
jgi:Ca2+-binding RTX toxin-like protein